LKILLKVVNIAFLGFISAPTQQISGGLNSSVVASAARHEECSCPDNERRSNKIFKKYYEAISDGQFGRLQWPQYNRAEFAAAFFQEILFH
jgi:hypothetical protein